MQTKMDSCKDEQGGSNFSDNIGHGSPNKALSIKATSSAREATHSPPSRTRAKREFANFKGWCDFHISFKTSQSDIIFGGYNDQFRLKFHSYRDKYLLKYGQIIPITCPRPKPDPQPITSKPDSFALDRERAHSQRCMEKLSTLGSANGSGNCGDTTNNKVNTCPPFNEPHPTITTPTTLRYLEQNPTQTEYKTNEN
uniref:Uncharacterized protein n=1 Tax=Glossina pallidipes TaxID=7398 RepID=A0A1A9ZI65_GLOPL